MPFCELSNMLDGAFLADSLMTDKSRDFGLTPILY
jgi:hypothetical protein